jgi:hypothetical protein
LQLSSKFEQLFKFYNDNIKLPKNKCLVKESVADSIRKSNFFVCCLTKKYTDSPNCVEELIYATRLHKPIFVLQINKIIFDDMDIIGLGSARFKYIPCYEHQFNWSNLHYDSIKNEFEDFIKVIKTFYWQCQRKMFLTIFYLLKTLDEKWKRDKDRMPIKNKYKIIKMVGEGVDGFVYKVEDISIVDETQKM